MQTPRVIYFQELMTQYKGFIKLFLNGRMPFTNDCHPSLPNSLSSMTGDVAFNVLMQSTSKSTSVFSEDAVHKKAKKDVQNILKFMADWLRLCKDAGRQPGQLIPAEPPSGHDRDQIYASIMQQWWRTAQCLRIYKLRLANSGLPENTPEAIRSALMSYNFAKRGISAQDEQFHRQEVNNDDPESVIYQVRAETDAGFIAEEEEESGDDDVPAAANAAVVRQRSGIVNQPQYHELPFPEPYHHELEYCLKCVEHKRAIMCRFHHMLQVLHSVCGQWARGYFFILLQ